MKRVIIAGEKKWIFDSEASKWYKQVSQYRDMERVYERVKNLRATRGLNLLQAARVAYNQFIFGRGVVVALEERATEQVVQQDAKARYQTLYEARKPGEDAKTPSMVERWAAYYESKDMPEQASRLRRQAVPKVAVEPVTEEEINYVMVELNQLREYQFREIPTSRGNISVLLGKVRGAMSPGDYVMAGKIRSTYVVSVPGGIARRSVHDLYADWAGKKPWLSQIPTWYLVYLRQQFSDSEILRPGTPAYAIDQMIRTRSISTAELRQWPTPAMLANIKATFLGLIQYQANKELKELRYSYTTTAKRPHVDNIKKIIERAKPYIAKYEELYSTIIARRE